MALLKYIVNTLIKVYNYSMKYLYITVLSTLFFVIPEEGFAYLDPATGSILYQVVIAAIVGIIGFFKLFKSKMAALFSKGGSKASADAEERFDNPQ